ncbi:hypothetical protein QTP70_027537, partial [Hemibagrus guttatus]
LTPIIMKCFERLVMRQIKDLLPLDPMQFVYHPNRSTDDAISTILHLCLTHLENKDTYVRMLFTDFSSAFNTIIPQHLTEKLSLLVINTFLCNWILDFLTGRPQSLRIGNSASSATALNTEAPQGCMLSPLLFILLTHDYAAMHSSNHIIKFADDMTVVGLISKNNKSAYREEVQRLTAWCKANNLSLNVEKMKEMVVDFRTAQSDHFPLNIINSRERDQNLQNPAVGAQSMDPPLRFKDGDSSLLHSLMSFVPAWRTTAPMFFFRIAGTCAETSRTRAPGRQRVCTLPLATVARTCRTMESPMITASHAISRRGAKRFWVGISRTGGGGGGEVLARGLACIFRCCCIQAAWYPGAGVNETWAGCVLALVLGREAHEVEVVGVIVSRREFTWDSTNFIPDRSRPGLTTTAIGAVDLQGTGGNWATVGRRSRGGRRVHRQREKRKGKSVGLRIGTLNVGTMTGKGRELADVMERRKVDILCVQETRWKGNKARGIGAGFKLFYYGVDSKRNGVGVVLKEEFVRNVLEVKRVSDRVMSLKLEIERVMLNVVSGYAPQVGCELEEKERFWSELDEVMESIPTGERVVIGADFNGHVGEGNTGDEEVMGKFGVKERNLEGQMVVDFAKRMDMGVVNTYFQKRMTLMVCKKKRSEIEKKTKWWKLKKEECCEEFRQKLRQALGGQVLLPDDWETTAEVIRETGRKVLGVSSGRRKEDKETWWWNEEVQDSVQRKRLAKKKWDMDRTEENRQEYKELQRRVKREVSKAKQKAYDELYTRLDTREGEKDLYRLARQRDRDGKDVQQVRVIKDRDGRVLTSEESVQRRWKEYFEELMNEENEREKRVKGVNSVEQKVDKIRKDEVRKALKRMKSGKAVGPDDIPVEVWKYLEKAYDRVPREELWYCIRKSGVAEKYVRVVQDTYERSRTVVRCAVGQTEEFNVEVGLHQGSALSPFLFAIVMDQLSEEVRQESPWTMMFADDIVICSESREQVEENLERWRFALERRGMKVSHSKTEYMCVNEREGSGTVRLQGEEVKKVQEFMYLGSTVQSNGECGKEVKKRVQAGWNGWRKVSGVLCERKISARIKGKVYRTVVRPAMLYGLETVALRKRQESELEVAELKMLRLRKCGVLDEGCAALTSALRPNPSNLRELNLSWNNLGDSRVKSLSAVLENLHCKLETVELRGCDVSDEDCAALTSALRSNPSHLRYQDLSCNHLGDSGVKSLSAGLENPHCKLERLK